MVNLLCFSLVGDLVGVVVVITRTTVSVPPSGLSVLHLSVRSVDFRLGVGVLSRPAKICSWERIFDCVAGALERRVGSAGRAPLMRQSMLVVVIG